MGRQGILVDEVYQAIKIIKENRYLSLEGVSSHFADADNQDKTFSFLQLENWKRCVTIFKKEFEDIKHFHISASSGVDINQKEFGNIVRLGIGLYGINISGDTSLNLKLVMRVESITTSIKELNEGESIGYGRTHILDKRKKIATVPFGYFEGIDRRLSNLGSVKIGETLCPILGRVSMNMISIDVSSVQDIKLEDKVIILSENTADENSVKAIAEKENTIPYDILVHIAPSLKRRVISDFN
ncbi:MAG: hypothetical protein RI945_324 [Candidatus Parcubacteria bacterium]